MSKLSKSLVIFFIVLLISMLFTNCYAVDLNLTETMNTTNSSDINDENEISATSNLVTDNTSFETDTISEEPEENESLSTVVSTVQSLPESNLGLSNILNILLITVGIVLIFLGIAILIKLNK